MTKYDSDFKSIADTILKRLRQFVRQSPSQFYKKTDLLVSVYKMQESGLDSRIIAVETIWTASRDQDLTPEEIGAIVFIVVNWLQTLYCHNEHLLPADELAIREINSAMQAGDKAAFETYINGTWR